MIARFLHAGAWHSFIVGLGPQSNGTTGPPPQIKVRNGLPLTGETLCLEYETVDPERDVLLYRVVRVEKE
jgi:hypothetical protein